MPLLRKTYSNYIIRRKSQLTKRGSVYERDWMTVSEMDGFTPGTVPVYASGNFKMTINNEANRKKKYAFSNWVLNDSGSPEWNLSMITEEQLKVRSNLINPNYSSILDFACYGSAVQLIYGSINDIYYKFPAEMYGTNRTLTFFVGNEKYETSGYYVENPFDIDVYSHHVNGTVDNPLRYLALSWDKYEVVIEVGDGVEETYEIKDWFPGNWFNDYCNNGDLVFDNAKIVVDNCDGGIVPTPPTNKSGCVVDADTIVIPMGNDSALFYPTLQQINKNIHEYNFDIPGNALEPIPEPEPSNCYTITFTGLYVNRKLYVISDKSGWHLRLKKKYIDESFESLDDFEKVLLNRETKPLYKAMFYTPRETENGVITSEVAYVWPLLSGGWNLDMETDAYASYLDGLLYMATYYDDCRSDNIWRSYTHESIKNFDWTTPRETYVPEIDGHFIDTERMEAILKVCGRQFDDLKRYIENIKFTVNVSYDTKNNMPDIALTKFLEMNGWEVKNVSPTKDNSLEVFDEYPGITVKNTPEEANNEFLKRMILNSRNILSKKGTRAGLEAMYSMFGLFDIRNGYKDGKGNAIGFEIDEYNVMSENYIYDVDEDNAPYTLISNVNRYKNNYGKDNYTDDGDFFGLMCEHKIDIDEVQYLVPWYDIYKSYDGRQYFQMMGGWGKRNRKSVYLPDLNSGITEIFSAGEVGIYDETVKDVRVSTDFSTLNLIPLDSLTSGDIYYVVDITSAYWLYGCDNSIPLSHYVVFYERNSNTVLPEFMVDYSDSYGWYVIPETDFQAQESDMPWYAKKVMYMESVHDYSVGNNPHHGNFKYDDGKEFFEFYKNLFKGSLENDMFSLHKARIAQENSRRHYENRFRPEKMPDVEDESEKVDGLGFTLTGLQKDNEKIWYFLSYDNGIYGNDEDVVNKLHKRQLGQKTYSLVKDDDFPLEVEARTVWNMPIYDRNSKITFEEATLDIPAEIRSYYPFGNPDETSSYSVINTKNLKITYHLPWELEDYVTDVVEFYVKQLIPSTVIVEFVWEYTDGPRPKERVPYASINLSPAYRRIRSDASEAEINISSVNVEGIGKTYEETEMI